MKYQEMKPDPTVGTAIEVKTLVDCDEYAWLPAIVTAVSWGSVTTCSTASTDETLTWTPEWWNSSAVRIVPRSPPGPQQGAQ